MNRRDFLKRTPVAAVGIPTVIGMVGEALATPATETIPVAEVGMFVEDFDALQRAMYEAWRQEVEDLYWYGLAEDDVEMRHHGNMYSPDAHEWNDTEDGTDFGDYVDPEKMAEWVEQETRYRAGGWIQNGR